MIHRGIALTLTVVLNQALAFTSIAPPTSLRSLQLGYKPDPLGVASDLDISSLNGRKSDTSAKIKMPTRSSTPIVNPADDKSANEESIDWFNTWLPLMPVDFLDREKPTPFQLLGMDIVVWNDGKVVEGDSGKPIGFGSKMERPWNSRREEGKWRAFVDHCPHRAAPLSEGRVEDDGTLMCSYHAWRFDGDGEVAVVPQAVTNELDRIKKNPKSSCNSFPTKVKNGLLWVWAASGSDARIKSELTPIVDMSLEGYFDDADESNIVTEPWTFRSVPHGWDYFIENILDPAHLPIAHHGVVSSRYTEPRPFFFNTTTTEISKKGFELQFRMNMEDPNAPKDGKFSTTYDFAAPSQVRMVTKAGEAGAGHIIEFYVSPAAPGVCNFCSRQILVKTKEGKVQFTGRKTRDTQIKALLLFAKLPVFLSHIARNKFLNQDTALCAIQERILHDSGYSTIKGDDEEPDSYAKATLPISADKGVLLFRKWFKRVSGGRVPFKGDTNFPPIEKDNTFDVYNSHTKYCRACSGALENLRKIRVALYSITLVTVIWNPYPVLGTGVFVAIFVASSLLATKLIDSMIRIEVPHGSND